MWKFPDFYVLQILREINFRESKSPKTAGFAIFEALKFVDLVNFSHPKSAKIHRNEKSEPLKVLQWQILHSKNP